MGEINEDGTYASECTEEGRFFRQYTDGRRIEVDSNDRIISKDAIAKTNEKFTPLDDEPLVPLSALLASATITDDDVLGAIEAWEGSPPDQKFDGILRADNADE